MTASLIVAGYELLGGTTNPEYRLAPGFAFGEGEPDQVTIASLYLDGEVVTGTRTRNRSMQLPLTVFGTGPADLASKVSTLMQAVNEDTFTVQWTPDGGLPIVFDCYRATARRPRNLVKDAAGQTQLTLEFQAKPFGRSPLNTTTGAAGITTANGFLTTLPDVDGDARTPVNLTLSLISNATFTTFLAHVPPADQDANVDILKALSTASTNQTVTVNAVNAKYAGTYSVVLGVGTSGGGSVTATVTITQRENGTAVGSTTALTRTYTSGPLLVALGEVTLPLYAVPSDNTLTTFLIQVQITGADRYAEIMLLDTAGQTIFTDTALSTARQIVWVDEPTALQSGPSVYAATGTVGPRAQAFSIMGNCVLTGGPPLFYPGANRVLTWLPTPGGTGHNTGWTYRARWLDERVI